MMGITLITNQCYQWCDMSDYDSNKFAEENPLLAVFIYDLINACDDDETLEVKIDHMLDALEELGMKTIFDPMHLVYAARDVRRDKKANGLL